MTDPGSTPRKSSGGAMRQFALATELPFLIVGGALVGGLMGYFLDEYLHTKPWLMIALGCVGFAGAVREMLRRLDKSNPDVPPSQ